MKQFISIVFFFLVVLTNINAQSNWTFELQGGGVYNVRMPLTINQQGYPPIKLSAKYNTEPFTLPVYWDIRLSKWKNGKSWEVETIHHKLYLDNTTSEVQKFNISHGFNLLIVNRGFDKKTFRYRAGAGIVLAHPESKIRGQEFGSTGEDLDMGYFVSGPVLNFAVNKPFYIGNRFYINAETKTTFAYSTIKIALGNADVYSLTFHLLLGFGFDFIKSQEEQ